MASPIAQFEIKPLVTLGKIGESPIAFTNSAAFMAITVAVIIGFLFLSTRGRSLVPSRWQSLAEISYEFVANTVRQSAGNEGMKFFPLVFSLFMFVLVANLIGLIPGTFTVTSHIIVTFLLAMLVFLTVVIYGFAAHGAHFFHLFVPSGVPGYVLPLVVVIEVISFLSRPISLSVRLFANMLAGHIALKIFAGFVASMLGAGIWAIFSPLPLALAVGLTALELLVAFLQAYVFTILTCIYLNDALHPGH
ncbi:F0F1 ATP synthase subunit A [Phreatobacter sp. AB_2022a]|uniref:F0F1 ATP synthase subunit A n=1 Tax=Phreatobacter sp. AB_2022a TaxID=3003134 RepID=UPI002286E43C|nr:F0F1 ATP synthase subunit A [Phreatobacter sp. AB_2022a]MCZ0736101.1 F0F1 ATP synthase subunit A [Phreatobacter sp. AB_2022a]